jgi:hypothetical protein
VAWEVQKGEKHLTLAEILWDSQGEVPLLDQKFKEETLKNLKVRNGLDYKWL